MSKGGLHKSRICDLSDGEVGGKVLIIRFGNAIGFIESDELPLVSRNIRRKDGNVGAQYKQLILQHGVFE